MTELIEAFKSGKKLHRKYALQIMLRVYILLKSLPSLVDVDIPKDTRVRLGAVYNISKGYAVLTLCLPLYWLVYRMRRHTRAVL